MPKKITYSLLIVYLIVLIWILMFKLGVSFSYMENRSVNLVPFKGLFSSNGRIDLPEIIMNVLIFMPLGIYIGVLYNRWSFGQKVLFFFLTSMLFEVLQYLLKIGAFDITDIITNTTGGILGLLAFEAMVKIFGHPAKAQKFINIVAGAGTVFMITFLTLLKMNMLPIRYQ